ncbi:MAG: DUF3618 domain-containing protein [Acidobacteria bacterium]|nr:DUF3618 domain-containing protein [Acidobacteriota bacterium]
MRERTHTTEPELTGIQREIERTRASLDRKLSEIERRIAPDHVKAELKQALKRRLDPEPYLGWIATGLVALGGWMAVRGARRGRYEPFPAGEYSIPT